MRRIKILLGLSVVLAIAIACVSKPTGAAARHRWWSGLGPVLPHDTFPGDCKLCHAGTGWNEMIATFKFNHKKETGVELRGAHKQAMCLRCHNDRGPIEEFSAKGCVGCHEDFHFGELGNNCTKCHVQETWRAVRQIELHSRTRFPLVGAHVQVACQRCHIGALNGNFVPTDTECLTCHVADLNNTNNPPHLGLGWVDNCQRCHMPTRWQQAVVPLGAQRARR